MTNQKSTEQNFWEYWLNSTTEFVFYKDLDGVYRGVSKATAELSGFDDIRDMIGKNDYEIHSKEMADTFTSQDKEVLQSNEPKILEDWMDHPKKGHIMIETIKSPMYDQDGNIIGVQGISRDITEKYLLNEKNKEQRSQLVAIFNHIPFALWIKDKKGKYLMINKEYENFYNVKKEDILYKEVMSTLKSNHLATQDTIQQLLAADKAVLDNKVISEVETPMEINGKERIVFITKAPILNEKQEAIGLLGLSHDVTDQKEYEKLLVKSKELAEEANRAKSDFLANMSHEIRTPMNGILGFIQLLSDTKLDDEQRDFVNEAKKSSEILLALLNDILDLSKIEAGKMTMEEISFNIRYVLEDVGTLASSNASSKGLEINVLCYSDIPERVLGDPSRLKQVLNNFVNNAIKFTPEGEINLTAKLIEKKSDKIKLKFEIQDTGIGIPEDAQAKIFESFTQADTSTTRKYGGTGLGLTISKNIIKMMNGEINVESKVNEGSKFSFTAEFKLDKTAESSFERKKNSIKGTKVLIVDDNKTNLKVVEHYLKEFNCKTTSAIDAIQALDIIKTEKDHFDLILTDYCMPKINGIDFAIAVKEIENYEKTPIILLSSRAQISDCKSVENNNLRAYLAKPVRKNDLIECIMLVMSKQENNASTPELVTAQTLREIRQEVKLKILLVEDNTMNQKLISKMLAKIGFTCDIANNGEEAIESYKNNAYDLIFMDCQMPVLDGYKATEAIRKIENETDKKVPIIALTANAMDQDIKNCYKSGMDDYLAKPLKQEFLIEKLAMYSEKKAEQEKSENNISKDKTYNLEMQEIIKSIQDELGIDESDAVELLNDFYQESKDSIETLEKELNAGNNQNAFEIAHSIKGASGNLRINRIFELAKEIEMRARENKLDGTLDLLSEIKDYAKYLFE